MPFDPSTADPNKPTVGKGKGQFDPSTVDPSRVAPSKTDVQDQRAKDVTGGDLPAAVTGIADVARAGITGTGAQIAGGLMGLATIGTNAMGLTDDDPVAQIKRFQDMASPIETEPGKKIAGAISKTAKAITPKPLRDLGPKMGEHFFQLTGSPLEATIAELMPDVMSTILGFQGPTFVKEAAMRGAGQLAKEAIINRTKDQAAKTWRGAGGSVSPTEYGSMTMRTIAGASGKAEVERIHSARNKQRVLDLAKINMDLPETASLGGDEGRANYRIARAKASQPYEEGRRLGRMNIDAEYLGDVLNAGKKFEQVAQDFPRASLGELSRKVQEERGKYLALHWDANSTIDLMGQLREEASDLLRSDSAVDRKLGFVKRDIAAALESRLWRHARDSGRPDLASRFQQGRKKLSQIHVWEDATNFDTGQISGRQIAAQRAMNAGTVDPFSDELKVVADAAGAFPQSFQDIDIKGRYGPISVFERYALVGGAVQQLERGALFGGGGVAMATGHHGMGLGLIAAGGAGIAGRELAGSRFATKGTPSYAPGPIREGLMNLGPGAQGAGAIAGAEAGSE